MEKYVNVLIPHSSGARDLADSILSLGLNRKDLFDSPIVKIGTNFRIIDIDDHLIEGLNRYIDWKLNNFNKFLSNDKFDFIVIPANSLNDYGINGFPTQEELQKISKEGCEVIIELCNVCSKCNFSMKQRYSNLDLKFMSYEDISDYILKKILNKEIPKGMIREI